MVGEDFGAEEEEEETESGGFRNTHKQTGWAANLFRKWLSENGFEPGFESLPAAELNRALREFYRGVRNHDGNTYSASSYKSLRAGLNRHLQSRSGQLPRRLCLIRDQEFSGANRAFTDVLKTLRAEGKDSPRYHTPVSPQDLRKIRHSGILGFQNPQSLVNKVWFDLQLHFAKRGSEMHRDLPHDAFRILRAPSGRRYAAFRYPEKGKRGYGDPERAGKMYDVPGDPYCPVFSLELYLSKLPPDPPAFYLRPVKLTPSQMQQQPVWYKREPMGVNYLGTMMPRLSSEARLSRRYTNHSLRSTAIRLLYDAGLGPREIMEVTGHRSDSAIRHLREVSETRYGTRETGEGSGEKGGKAYGRIEEESGRRVELIDRNNNIDIKDLSGVNEADRAVLCCPPPSGQREQSWSDGGRDLEEGEEGFSLIDRDGTCRSEVRLHPPSELSQHSGPQKLSFLATGREGFECQAPIFLNTNPEAPPGPSSCQTSSPLKRVTLLLCRPPQNSPGLESRLRGPSAPYRKILARGSGMEIRNEPVALKQEMLD